MKQNSFSFSLMRIGVFMTLLIFIHSISFAKTFRLDGIVYNVLSEQDKTCETDDWDTPDENIVLPENPNGYKLVKIGNLSFERNNYLKSITLPSSVTTIGVGAFEKCVKLTEINLSSSLEKIENNAFFECTSLVSIVLPPSLNEIEYNAFNNCSALSEIKLPVSLTKLGTSVFYDCSSLKKIEVDDGNPYYSSYEGVLYNKDQTELICFPPAIGEIILSPKLTTLNCSFSAIKNLKKYIVPETITSIGSWVFYFCYDLEEVIIPNSVTSIGDFIFYECPKLYKVILPENLTKIGDGMFYRCLSLKEINIPSSITSIGMGAFYECSSLSSMVIPASVESIGDNAFYNCKLNPLKFMGLPDLLGDSYLDESVISCDSEFYNDFKDRFPYEGIDIVCWDNQYCLSIIPDGLSAEFKIEDNPYWDPEIINSDYKLEVYDEYDDLIKEFNIEQTGSYQVKNLDLSTRYKVISSWTKANGKGELSTNFETLAEVSSVEAIDKDEKPEVVGYFTSLGQKIKKPQKGVNIILYSNGQTKKLIF